ncbi:MAG: DNA phosphorothioation-dependent restriction protein DptF [Clostridium sp.]|nr:DNA phosphorothioation-dependent restriction protein DptF [Clostridium sp.]
MKKDVYSYLEKDYRFLINYIDEINKVIFVSPHEAIIKGRTYVENLTKEITNLENHGLMIEESQFERIKVLDEDGVFTQEILDCFHAVRLAGNKAAHDNVEGELEIALNVHKNIYKITCWFVEVYIDHNFEAEPYKNPMPVGQASTAIDMEILKDAMQDTLRKLIKNDESIKEQVDDKLSDVEKKQQNKNIDDGFTELIVQDIIENNSNDEKCLVSELEKLKESSMEAVESLNSFSPFKKYMHVIRDAQKNLEELIIKANDSNTAQLILVCGSVGDGKSHIISYFKDQKSDIMKNFKLHNDATESLEPSKTSMDTLNEVLDEFSDEKIENSKQKFILAINLGTLNNFIDSKYGERFTKLKEFVHAKKILDSSIEDSSYDSNSNFQYVNFSDYHLFTLKDGRVYSKYIKDIISRITESKEIELSERNYFYFSYKRYCLKCENNKYCPIKANYELLAQSEVQDAVVDFIVQCIVKNKIIISTRALLNFIYELIVPRSYIDVNSPTFKSKIFKLNVSEYVNSLMPNIIFNHKELSFIFEALNSIDPLNVRNEKVDDFIIDFNNSSDVMGYFKDYINYPEGYLGKVENVDVINTENKKIRHELLKLFIRSYAICGKKELFSLKDDVYEEYINALFHFNKGDKLKLKKVYENVKNGIMKWNGEADKKFINIFIGRNQTKYKISEKVELKADTSNLPKSEDNDLKKFIGTLNLQYKNESSGKTYKIDIDYSLYKLLVQVNDGYRPNKKDKNHFIKFVEFINKLEETGSQNTELVITEKNRENNKKFKLEFDDEFETYRFVEID